MGPEIMVSSREVPFGFYRRFIVFVADNFFHFSEFYR